MMSMKIASFATKNHLLNHIALQNRIHYSCPMRVIGKKMKMGMKKIKRTLSKQKRGKEKMEKKTQRKQAGKQSGLRQY